MQDMGRHADCGIRLPRFGMPDRVPDSPNCREHVSVFGFTATCSMMRRYV